MTPDMETEFLKELKKMNGFLEAIDWKLWNMHRKFVEGGAVTASSSLEKVTEPTKTETVVTETAVPAIPKYPSIEKWSS